MTESDSADRWQFWVDRGGTFTDVVARRPDGRLETAKVLSEHPERARDAAVEGVRRLMGLAPDAPVPSAAIAAVKMGTTVATNALLERKGERTVLVTTRGFADALRIGYQNRPRLFDRRIVLPELLYERVVEVPERICADGTVLEAVDLAEARRGLEAAYNVGIRACAVAFLHAYRHPQHEEAVAAEARAVGFSQVSVSHTVSPLIKLVGRGDTTVVDAYLSPILRRYVDQVAAALGDLRLMFMQSNGGLTDAGLFQGKDSILSGPAGGIVGAARVAAMAGLDRIITFDMGGTSTDVAHYAGSYERTFESQVAGVRMRAPMLDIHTVAAGGGSICHFDGARYRVGPDSAGADPGPACYRRGGPLTVTDCNVMLGKLQPAFFPAVFGPQADQRLDDTVVHQAFADLADRIHAATGDRRSPAEVAEGFLRIAVDNMASAIKHLSIRRGHDVTQYALVSFGGAGGQHACLVADALGMTRVLIHPLAGVLSAYGMGLAEIRALREASVEHALDGAGVADADRRLHDLAAEADRELSLQGVAATAIWKRAHLRYEGTDTAMAVPFGSVTEMQSAFDESHQRQFGFTMSDRRLAIAAVSVEAVGGGSDLDEPEQPPAGTPLPAPMQVVAARLDGQDRQTPMYDREALGVGHRVDGPTILRDANATTVVEPGWRAEVTARGHLLMTRVVPLPARVAVGTDVDPVMLEVFNNLFMSIAEQMGLTLQNTAYSVNIKERLDFSCAVFDPDGRLVANAPHIPVHLGSMGTSVRHILSTRRGGMAPGDVYMLNDPYHGGTHLPDVTLITPVFDPAGREVLFFVASRGHHADVGGATPGSMPPDSRTIDEEGVLIDDFLLVRGGRFREAETRALFGGARYPARNIDHNIADLKAQIAANAIGARELGRIVDLYGLPVVHAYMGHVRANAAEQVRRVLGTLTAGRFVQPMDNGAEIHVAITVDAASRSARVDFTGTSGQLADNFNAPRAVVEAAVLYVFRTLVEDDIPLNDGCLAPIDIVVPEGCMLNPHAPAAVAAGNVETSQAVTNALFGALGVLAAAQGTMNNLTFGDAEHQYYETICGGAGAGPDFDGASAVHTHMTNSRLTDPEVLELRFPVLLETFAIRRGSGGLGRHRGGDGITRRLRFLKPMTAAILANHRKVRPFGMAGGRLRSWSTVQGPAASRANADARGCFATAAGWRS